MSKPTNQVRDAADLLAHFHLEHSNNARATRLRGKSCDIYIISAPDLRASLTSSLKEEFEEPPVPADAKPQ